MSLSTIRLVTNVMTLPGPKLIILWFIVFVRISWFSFLVFVADWGQMTKIVTLPGTFGCKYGRHKRGPIRSQS